MKNKLENSGIMYYSFSRHLTVCYCLRVFALAISLLGAVLSQHIVLAQSDDLTAALDSRRNGLLMQNKGEFRKALFYYQRAMVLQPKNASFVNDVGLMEEYLGQNKNAEQRYLKAISLDRNYLPAYSNLGILYYKQRQYSLAARYLQQRVDQGKADDPWTLEAQEALMQVYKAAPALESERICAQADAFNKSIVSAKQKMKQTAKRNKALDFEMAYQKGINLIKINRFTEAVEMLETAVVLNPRSQAARYALKKAQYGQEKVLLEKEAGILMEDKINRNVTQALDVLSPP